VSRVKEVQDQVDEWGEEFGIYSEYFELENGDISETMYHMDAEDCLESVIPKEDFKYWPRPYLLTLSKEILLRYAEGKKPYTIKT